MVSGPQDLAEHVRGDAAVRLDQQPAEQGTLFPSGKRELFMAALDIERAEDPEVRSATPPFAA